MLVYFGFTHCPDVCPEELDKMSSIINMVKDEETNAKVVPVFITVDAERDGPAQIKEYLKGKNVMAGQVTSFRFPSLIHRSDGNKGRGSGDGSKVSCVLSTGSYWRGHSHRQEGLSC